MTQPNVSTSDETIFLGDYPFCLSGVDQSKLIPIFEKRATMVKELLGETQEEVHVSRMGSSAIPGIPGTPVCDILVEISRFPLSDEEVQKLTVGVGGWEFKGAAPHYKDDQWFFGGEEGVKPGHLGRFVMHVVPKGCEFAAEMRGFVEYVVNTPDAFKRYADVKTEGAIIQAKGDDPNPVLSYKKHKDDVVLALKKEMRAWLKSGR
eukprot:CAMPEP_0172486454 /NCGR_PEP_ID=MMETSP1066-20121228/15038_1 /TAXON_ID=671091 /ORGANISM="Coscinodiscus wailesii, Strain CCMP2513" /LENGTH=205 /DNA_ID=CAMNT_0013252423 /DNA_START=127 /DNA_END=744 /DNA_ORIENTATION=+